MQILSTERQANLFREITRLRYDVYCAERGFLNKADYANGEETDQYDVLSVHVAATDRSGISVGTARLILGSQVSEFPFEQHCTVYPDLALPQRWQSAEVSRLIARSNAHRRAQPPAGGGHSGGVLDSHDPIRIDNVAISRIGGSQITLELYRAMYRYSLRAGIRYWYAAMEKGLARLLGRMGFQFVPIGPQGDYYGPVAIYLADLRKVEDCLRQNDEATLAWFRDAPASDGPVTTTLIEFDDSPPGDNPKHWTIRYKRFSSTAQSAAPVRTEDQSRKPCFQPRRTQRRNSWLHRTCRTAGW